MTLVHTLESKHTGAPTPFAAFGVSTSLLGGAISTCESRDDARKHAGVHTAGQGVGLGHSVTAGLEGAFIAVELTYQGLAVLGDGLAEAIRLINGSAGDLSGLSVVSALEACGDLGGVAGVGHAVCGQADFRLVLFTSKGVVQERRGLFDESVLTLLEIVVVESGKLLVYCGGSFTDPLLACGLISSCLSRSSVSRWCTHGCECVRVTGLIQLKV